MDTGLVTTLIVVGVVVVILVIIGIYLWVTYNSLVTLKVRVDEAWSDISVQLKRRADLIPTIVDTVKGTPPTRRPSSTTSPRRARRPSRPETPGRPPRPRGTCRRR